MQKFIIAIAVAVFAFSTSMFTPPAHAGMKGKIAVGLALGAMAVMAHQHRKNRIAHRRAKERYYARKKSTAPRTYVAKKSAPEPQYVAETVQPEDVPLPEQKVATDVETENSSITTAALTDTDVNDPAIEDETVTEDDAVSDNEKAVETKTEVGSLGCKKFFPSVGMTLSVPCEAQTAQ